MPPWLNSKNFAFTWSHEFFASSTLNTRGHQYKLTKYFCLTNCRSQIFLTSAQLMFGIVFFVTQWTINSWLFSILVLCTIVYFSLCGSFCIVYYAHLHSWALALYNVTAPRPECSWVCVRWTQLTSRMWFVWGVRTSLRRRVVSVRKSHDGVWPSVSITHHSVDPHPSLSLFLARFVSCSASSCRSSGKVRSK